jgi:hypothetical protein
MADVLCFIVAVFGAVALYRALVGRGRGEASPGDQAWRLRKAVSGASLLAVAGLTVAPLGLLGGWAGALGLGAALALWRPVWMGPTRQGDRKTVATAYAAGAGGLAVLWLLWSLIEPGPLFRGRESDFTDLVTLGSLLLARGGLWFWSPGAPFGKRERERIESETRPWWEVAWERRESGGDASFADAWAEGWGAAEATRRASAGGGSARDSAFNARDAEAEADDKGPGARAAARDPAAADHDLVVPGYDPELLAEELAAFRTRVALIDRVAAAWPDHPVAEGLVHVSAILGETRRYLQDHPDKYRDLRPILVGHATTAADIARLVERIKQTGEALDDPDGLARRLFALASLMREARRRSTQAERDRLKASMAIIDDELSQMSAVKDLRARLE